MERNGFTEADFAEVRGRVLGTIRRRRRVWAVAYSTAAAALVVLAWGLWAGRTPPADTLPLTARVVVPPAPPARAVRPAVPAPRPPVAVMHRAAPVPPPRKIEEPDAEPLLVKLETPDPNVVIYWIVEGKGDSE